MKPDINETKDGKQELKWGNEEIKQTIDNDYLYKDPTKSMNEVEPVVEENNTNVEVPTAVQIEPPVVEPVVPIQPQIDDTKTVSLEEENVSLVPTLEPPVLENEKKGKLRGILLFFLFVFLFAFIMFLPEITEFINTQKYKAENNKPTPTPSATATPIASPDFEISLDSIADAFNTNETVISMKASSIDTILTASVRDKTLVITYQVPSNNIDFVNTYTLENDILSTTSADSTTGPILVEVISLLQGNSKGSSKLFFQQDSALYLLAVDGIELRSNEDNTWQIKVDLTKKMNVIDPSTVSIELSDLEKNRDTLMVADSSDYLSKGNIVLMKETSQLENRYIIYLGEKGEFSDNSYKSLLAIVEFYLDRDVDGFKNAYPSIIQEEKIIDKVKVSIPTNEDENIDAFNRLGTYQVLLIEITK